MLFLIIPFFIGMGFYGFYYFQGKECLTSEEYEIKIKQADKDLKDLSSLKSKKQALEFFKSIPLGSSIYKSEQLTDIGIKEKKKAKQTTIDSAFLKAETIWKEIVLEDIIKEIGVFSYKTLKIKIEVLIDIFS